MKNILYTTLISIFILSGCNEIDFLKSTKEVNTYPDELKVSENFYIEDTEKNMIPETTTENQKNIEIEKTKEIKKPKNSVKESYEKTVNLYFIGENANYKFEIEKTILNIENNGIAKAIILELLKDNNKLRNGIPEGTKLLSINLKNDTLYVDLSSEIQKNTNLGSVYETMMIYSIVNSLTELENVTYVQFLINGNFHETLSHIDISKPFEKNLNPIGT